MPAAKGSARTPLGPIKFDSLPYVVKSMHWRPTVKNINCKGRMCKMFGTSLNSKTRIYKNTLHEINEDSTKKMIRFLILYCFIDCLKDSLIVLQNS